LPSSSSQKRSATTRFSTGGHVSEQRSDQPELVLLGRTDTMYG
jgi:hypothetical protein